MRKGASEMKHSVSRVLVIGLALSVLLVNPAVATGKRQKKERTETYDYSAPAAKGADRCEER
jgi:hypothetical protein